MQIPHARSYDRGELQNDRSRVAKDVKRPPIILSGLEMKTSKPSKVVPQNFSAERQIVATVPWRQGVEVVYLVVVVVYSVLGALLPSGQVVVIGNVG